MNIELLRELQKQFCTVRCEYRDVCRSYEMAQNCMVYKLINELLKE